jgi:L-cysteine S-thiosulfotransferase
MKNYVMAALLGATLSSAALAQSPDPKKIDGMIEAMFSKVSPEWKARTVLDETQRACTDARGQVSAKAAEAIQARELKTVVFPADGKLTGDWKKGYQVANSGRGWQFSDPEGTVPGGNCYACHQMDPKELSYGTLGPSLAAYGKDRKGDAEAMKTAWIKLYNSNAAVACSTMPRFGTQKALTEAQLQDVMAYLFDPESPVNK